MSNPYFTKSGYPGTNARAVSASLRSEIANIEAGFDLLPTLSGNGSKVIAVNAGATALEASSAPDIGVATATSVNKVTITPPATSATLTIANGKTLTASNTLTLAGTDGTTLDINAVTELDIGSYTPTPVSGTNITSITAATLYFFRIGTMMNVFGKIGIRTTAVSAASDFTIDLPVASNIGDSGDLSGHFIESTSAALASQQLGAIFGEPTSNAAQFDFTSLYEAGDGVRTHTVNFSYRII